METREIKLTLSQAKELYKQGGSFKSLALGAYTEEELTKPKLPKSWEEWRKQNSRYDKEWCIDLDGDILSFEHRARNEHDDSMFATKDDAEAFLTLIKLKRLRDCYRQGWKPNWNDDSEIKSIISCRRNSIVLNTSTTKSSFLSFQSDEIRNEFLVNFRDMIEQVKEFI